MKTPYKILPVLALIFILAPHKVSGREEYTKVIKKEYTVNADAQVILDNKFGQIHCNNWDKNLVAIEIRITVSASSQEKANNLMDMVTISSDGTPSKVETRTNFSKEGFSGNSKVTVDYTVNMPASVSLNLTNKFGDVFLNELTGAGNFNISYGNIEINALRNSNNVIDIKFGKGDITWITGAMVAIKYSDFKVEYAGSLNVDSKFSNLEAARIVSLAMGFEGGKVDVKSTSVVSGTSKFSDLNFNFIETKMDLSIQYGNCDVDKISADFNVISVRNKYGDVSVNIPAGTSYNLDADLKFCDLDFPEDQTNLTQKIVTNTWKSFKGTVGKNPAPEAKVIVKSEYGNVSLE
jgi:hypothetical protein